MPLSFRPGNRSWRNGEILFLGAHGSWDGMRNPGTTIFSDMDLWSFHAPMDVAENGAKDLALRREPMDILGETACNLGYLLG